MAKKNIPAKPDIEVLNSIAQRAQYLATQMIYIANHRPNKEKGDPKIGGHAAASASSLHILAAIHLIAKSGFDHIANKPHASPADHAYNYLLGLLLHQDNSRLTREESNKAMSNLRAFPHNNEEVFQSYHSAYDPDRHNFFPTGTVGIPPVQAGYLALAYRYAKDHGYQVPEAHFWSIIGDSEFREGSLFEAVPDFAEREIGNLTWILDYNRQSLDGHRITNANIMGGTDDERIAKTMAANGWHVIQLRHGSKRKTLMKKVGGDSFCKWLEEELSDYGLQVLLQIKEGALLRKELEKNHSILHKFLKNVNDQELWMALRDLGGHDIECLTDALEESKKETRRPTIIIAHTLKGWGLKMAATPGNHSALPDADEIESLKKETGILTSDPFSPFPDDSPEEKFLKARGDQLYKEILEQEKLKESNISLFQSLGEKIGEVPETMDINLKLASYPHTQWMLGQLTAKLTRIANTPLDEQALQKKQKALVPAERSFKIASEMLVSMAPDVGTSTNLNPAMDGHIFGVQVESDYEASVGVKDSKLPDLIPGEEPDDRYLRFEIAEGNVMSCMGSFGKIRDFLGIPLLPLMTVYDFFIKRAHDQYFYDQYWKSSFILCGTPSGVTLSPEGAQHGWKSDLQIPNQITWEPFFCQELDWILCDAIKRHLTFDNENRSGVVIRGVTRGVEQKDLLRLLRNQRRFKVGLNEDVLLTPNDIDSPGTTPEGLVECQSDEQILAIVRREVLAGGYTLIDYSGYAGYEPGDNVVNIFAMGSLGTEAIQASQQLLKIGIFANVIMVTSPDLLVGNLGFETNYYHLKEYLRINSNLHLVPMINGSATRSDVTTLAGRRIPIVSVHDGEPGLLDNIGSIVGVKQEALAVRKHSRCGRPADIYAYHGIDAASVIKACGKVLAETALEHIELSSYLVEDVGRAQPAVKHWRELWPT